MSTRSALAYWLGGNLQGQVSAEGLSAGSSVASAVGSARAVASGSAAGATVASGAGSAVAEASGVAGGSATAVGAAVFIVPGAGLAAGSSIVAGSSLPLAFVEGTSTVAGTVRQQHALASNRDGENSPLAGTSTSSASMTVAKLSQADAETGGVSTVTATLKVRSYRKKLGGSVSATRYTGSFIE